MSLGYCRKCREPLAQGRRFCGSCGHPSPIQERAHSISLKKRSDTERGAIQATAIVFIGSLLAVLAPVYAWIESVPIAGFANLAVVAGVAYAGAICLGRDQIKATWGQRAEPRWLWIGLAIGCVSFAISYGYVESLPSLFGWEEMTESEEATIPLVWLVLDVVLLTAVLEEWLCRGVLWTALDRIAGKWVVIFLTAFLFALLHSFNGLFMFEWPHRFVLGALCGWLRSRSGSLWPGVLAHALNNALAVAFDRF